MFPYFQCVFFAMVAIAFAAPSPAPAPAPAPGAILSPALAYTALPAALPISSSSQSFVRNHNTFAAAPLAYSAGYAAYPAYPYGYAPAAAAYYTI